MEYQFANVHINVDNFELEVDDKTVEIEPLIFDVLVYLMKHQGMTVSKDALIETVWKGRIVSDTTISTAIKMARKCINDNGKEQRFIKTVHGRGFRFLPEIDVLETNVVETKPLDVSVSNEEDDIPSSLSLLVLPFQYSDNTEESEYIASSVPDEIENLLSRVPLLSISSESLRYAQQTRPTGRQIYEELGITYLLDGRVRVVGKALIVTVQLTDNKSGFKIWSSDFNYSLQDNEDIYALNKRVVLEAVAHIEPQLNRSIFDKITTSRTPRNSRVLFLQANSLLAVKGWRASTFNEAVELLEESCQLDPDFALAHALRALLLSFGVRMGVLSNRETAVKKAMSAAAKALELDSMNSTILGYVGCAYCDMRMTERGIPLLKNAIRANSANGQAWVALGAAELLTENAAEAVKNLIHGIEISPFDNRLAVWRSILCMGLVLQKRIPEALEHAHLACQEDANLYMPRVALAAINLILQQKESAQAAISEAFAVKPDLSKSEVYALVGKELGQHLID